MSYNYNFNRKEIASEEIASRMNFGEVLSNYKIVTKPFYKTGWFAAGTAITVIGVTALLLTTGGNEDKNKEQVIAQNNTENKIAYKEDSPCIKPPRKKADLPFTTYHIKNETGGTFIHSSGSEINIPANTFVINSKPVEGDIEIRYREFRDQADFILSGIPMTYDSAGTKYHFESAGMLEIRAYKNNEPVEMKGEIAVNFASDYDSNKYNFYYLDEEANNWACLGKDQVTGKEHEPPEKIPDNKETEKSIKQNEQLLAEVQNEIKSLQETKPEEPIKRNTKNYSFTLDVLSDEFPELEVFKGTRFEVSPINGNKFSPKLFDESWEDISIKRDNKSGHLQMTLARGLQKKGIIVYPVYDGKKYAEMKAKFDADMNDYNSRLNNRLNEEKETESKLAALRKQFHQKSREISEQWAEKRRQNGEVRYTSGTYDNGVTNEGVKEKNVRVVAGSLINEGYQFNRSLKLPSLGVFNCDHAVSRPIREKGKKHKLRFFNKDGMSLGMMVIYLLEKKRNVMFTYEPEDFEKIRVSEDGENTIVGIMNNGKIAVALPVDIGLIDWEQEELEIKMQVFPEVKNSTELKKILYPNS